MDRYAIDDGHRIDEALLLYQGDHVSVCGNNLWLAGVMVSDPRTLSEAMLDLSPDDRRDLLRRPGRSSSTAEAGRLSGEVEYLDVDGRLGHTGLLCQSYGTTRAA